MSIVKFKNEHHVVFAGAKTQCIKNFIKPTAILSPNQIIIHYITNNLPSIVESTDFADNVMSLARNKKSDVIIMALSVIILRNDRFFKQMLNWSTAFHKKLAKKEKIPFISHHAINQLLDKNSRGLYLNDKGSASLAQNFRERLV